jgi:hypothetical protein
MTDDSGEIVKWLGIRLRVPKDWEIVRHSVNLEKGSLVFVNRRRETLRLLWRDCERALDLNRMLDDQRSKMALEVPGGRLSELHGVGRWQGFVREESENERVVHAAHFDSPSLRLIEVIVTEAGDAASGKSLRAQLLGNLAVTSKAELAREFRAFGLDVAVPAGFRLVKTDVKPADVTFEFDEALEGSTTRASGASATLRRLGMAASWAPADKSQLLAAQAPTLTFKKALTCQKFGHSALLAEGKEVHPRLLNWLGLGRRGQALLWHCEATNAIYSITTAYPKRTPVAVEAFSMPCCGASDA